MDSPSGHPEGSAHQASAKLEKAGFLEAHGAAGHRASTNWCLVLFYGASVGLTSLMLVGSRVVTPITLMSFIGVCWFILGMLAFLCMSERSNVAWAWSLLVGTLGVIAGVNILRDPDGAGPLALTFLVVALGATGLAAGALGAIRNRSNDRFIAGLVLGAINLAFGLVLLQATSPTLFMAPSVFGPLLLLQGIGLIVWAAVTAPSTSG